MTLTGDIIPGSMVLVKAFSEKTAGIAKKVPPVDTGWTCIQNGTDLAIYCNAVNGQFTGIAANKASVQLALIGRSGLAVLCKGIAGKNGMVDGDLANIGRTHHYADTPAAIIRGVQFGIRHRAVGDGVIGGGVCTGVTDDTAHRAFGRDFAVVHRAFGDGHILSLIHI